MNEKSYIKKEESMKEEMRERDQNFFHFNSLNDI